MAGGTLSAAGSFKGTVTVPQGLNFVVGDVLGPLGFLSTPTEAFSTEVHVNKFSMDYYDSGEVSTPPCLCLGYVTAKDLIMHILFCSRLFDRFHSFALIFHYLTLTGRRY